MTEDKKQILEDRHRPKTEYGVLCSEVERMLLEHDPAGINDVDNTNEYSPEMSQEAENYSLRPVARSRYLYPGTASSSAEVIAAEHIALRALPEQFTFAKFRLCS